MRIKQGEYIDTPRFCKVKIEEIFTYEERESAHTQGYTEPTHYNKDERYQILGKSLGDNRMQFAAIEKVQMFDSDEIESSLRDAIGDCLLDNYAECFKEANTDAYLGSDGFFLELPNGQQFQIVITEVG
jgi:hypothetical protein